MKKIPFIIMLAGLCACTQKLELPQEPDIKTGSNTVVTAAVSDVSGQQYVWETSSCIGLYDSEGRTNVKYTLLSAYDGKTGTVELYGFGANGTLKAYMPYNEKGYDGVADDRQPVKSEQKWCASAEEHWNTNIVMVAQADDKGFFQFDSKAGNIGLIHFILKFQAQGEVRELRLHCPSAALAGDVAGDSSQTPLVVNGSNILEITGLKQACSPENPLEFWAMVPAATYGNMTVSALDSKEWISSPVSGLTIVEAGKTAEASVDQVWNSSENQDFNIIDGNYK